MFAACESVATLVCALIRHLYSMCCYVRIFILREYLWVGSDEGHGRKHVLNLLLNIQQPFFSFCSFVSAS